MFLSKYAGNLLSSVSHFRSILNKKRLQEYIEKYALNPNTSKYPYYKDDDCTNFVSQVLAESGNKQLYGSWNDFNSWFCSTNNSSYLHKVSLTWRSARYFRRHFSNEDGLGKNRAIYYKQFSITEAINNYKNLYNILDAGSVLQYINLRKNPYPYHSQVVHKKIINPNGYDILVAQHSKNLKDLSLLQYLNSLSDKDSRILCIYKFY